MKILVRAKADQDLDDIFGWIVKDSPRAAVKNATCGIDQLEQRKSVQWVKCLRNSDAERAALTLKGAEGKRLTYRRLN
jgi:hypothetical protein